MKESINTPEFKSEIDWGKWNPDTPNHPELIKEYNEIEKRTKTNDTWMKNEDGTPFDGTPEQFVQQQSSWFKQNLPNVIKDQSGRVQISYHGQRSVEQKDSWLRKKLPYFISNKLNKKKLGEPFNEFKYIEGFTRIGGHGKGIYTFVGNKEKVENYVMSLNGGKGYLYELYINSNNPQKSIESVFSSEFNQITGRLQPGFDYLRVGEEQVIPFENYPKSAIGNVGFFDMNDPNIYK